METIIYTSCIGAFAFDQNFNLVDKLEFEDIKNIDFSEWLNEEKNLIKKYSKNKVFFLGLKKEKMPNVILTQDIRKLEAVSEFLMKNNYSGRIREICINRTKEKVKDSVTSDLLIIQAVSSISEIEKTTSTLVKRLREWYELHNPEFSRSVEDHQKFIEAILKKNKKELLGEIKVKITMGADFEKEDLDAMFNLAKELENIYALKNKQEEYLEKIMKKAMPNVTEIAGSFIGAQLVGHAGSLQRLAEMPSSTLQLLGAEKALFRHLRNKKALPPKYGVLHEHPLIAKSKRSMHGKIARALADKISLAAKLDYFKGEFMGDKLRKALEEKFK
ncbi:MAG: NOP5/NOP56 family protein [Candidatus Woesearchaeota archaeon]|nr:NOP5/NOP56 family protein [Candidatus Woesearchaeota archaeon]